MVDIFAQGLCITQMDSIHVQDRGSQRSMNDKALIVITILEIVLRPIIVIHLFNIWHSTLGTNGTFSHCFPLGTT